MDSDLEKMQKLLATATAGMSDEELQWHPKGKWSAAEVLEHLFLTYTGTIKAFERAMHSGRPLASPPTIKHRLQAFVVFGLNYLPSGRKAPPHALPRGLIPEQVNADIQGKIHAMEEIIGECERRLGSGPLLDHPILGPLTAKQWRKFHLIHGRHHARQIAHLREQMKKSAASSSQS
jgi:hypothetical protein